MGYRYDKYGKTVTPHEHSMKLERGDSDAIAYQKYIEQNPELHNLTENMGVGDVRKYTTFQKGLILTPRTVSSWSLKPVETKSSIVESQKEPKSLIVLPSAKKELEKQPRKLKTEYIVAIIGAAATLLAALIGILPQIIKPAPVPTMTTIATMRVAQTPVTTFTVISPSETSEPSPTLTKVSTLKVRQLFYPKCMTLTLRLMIIMIILAFPCVLCLQATSLWVVAILIQF